MEEQGGKKIDINVYGLSRFEKKRAKSIESFIIKVLNDYPIFNKDMEFYYLRGKEVFECGEEEIRLGDNPYMVGDSEDKMIFLMNNTGEYKRQTIVLLGCAFGTIISTNVYLKYIGLDIDKDPDPPMPEWHIQAVMASIASYVITDILMSYDKELGYKYLDMFDYIDEAFINNEKDPEEINTQMIYSCIGVLLRVGITVEEKWKAILEKLNNKWLYETLIESEEKLRGLCDTVVNKKEYIGDLDLEGYRNIVKRIDNNIHQ